METTGCTISRTEGAKDEDRFTIICTHCGDYADEGNADGGELLFVERDSFCEYFGVEDEGPKKPPASCAKDRPR